MFFPTLFSQLNSNHLQALEVILKLTGAWNALSVAKVVHDLTPYLWEEKKGNVLHVVFEWFMSLNGSEGSWQRTRLAKGARLGSSGTPDPRLPHLLPNEIRSPIDKHRLLI